LKVKFAVLFLPLILIPLGFSQVDFYDIDDFYNSRCLNSTLLERSTYMFINDSGVEENLTMTFNITCSYGCSDNHCQEASVLNMTLFSLFFASGLMLMLISSISTNDTFGLVGALIIMLLGVYLAVEGLVIGDILHKNTLTRMVAIAMIMVGLYTMYAFGASQFGKKGEDDELSQ